MTANNNSMAEEGDILDLSELLPDEDDDEETWLVPTRSAAGAGDLSGFLSPAHSLDSSGGGRRKLSLVEKLDSLQLQNQSPTSVLSQDSPVANYIRQNGIMSSTPSKTIATGCPKNFSNMAIYRV